jgi:hypothetical protein
VARTAFLTGADRNAEIGVVQVGQSDLSRCRGWSGSGRRSRSRGRRVSKSGRISHGRSIGKR